jgi:hypothetical protein
MADGSGKEMQVKYSRCASSACFARRPQWQPGASGIPEPSLLLRSSNRFQVDVHRNGATDRYRDVVHGGGCELPLRNRISDRFVQRRYRRRQFHFADRPYLGNRALRIDQYFSNPNTSTRRVLGDWRVGWQYMISSSGRPDLLSPSWWAEFLDLALTGTEVRSTADILRDRCLTPSEQRKGDDGNRETSEKASSANHRHPTVRHRLAQFDAARTAEEHRGSSERHSAPGGILSPRLCAQR